MKKNKNLDRFYLLVAWNGIEMEILGPYATEVRRDEAAARVVRKDPERDHGIWRLNLQNVFTKPRPVVYDYSGAATDKWPVPID